MLAYNYRYNASKYVARAQRLRKLMGGPPDPTVQQAKIKEIVDERIAELTAKIDAESGASSGPDAEPG